jgi:hypothetical protein
MNAVVPLTCRVYSYERSLLCRFICHAATFMQARPRRVPRSRGDCGTSTECHHIAAFRHQRMDTALGSAARLHRERHDQQLARCYLVGRVCD